MKFTEDHDWLRVEDGLVVVGVTAYAAENLGDMVFVELPEVEDEVSKGQDVAVVESVKAATDVLCPLDGVVVAINEELVDNPGLVNEDPQGKAWLFKLKVDDLSAVDGFLTEEEYKKTLE